MPVQESDVINREQPAFSSNDAHSSRLPGEYYWTEQQFQTDLSKVFLRNWLFVAHTLELSKPGDFITVTIGRDSIIVVRDKSGRIHAFFNSCRHRGSMLTDQSCGNLAKFVCPYHQWVYGLDGRLESCRLMEEEIDKESFPLHNAHVESVEGLIFLCLAKEAPSFEPAREVFSRFMRPHCPEQTKLCVTHEYLVEANWKTIFENNRECYHCSAGHREFCQSNFDYGMPGDPRSSKEFTIENDRMQRKWKELGLEPGPINFSDGQWFRCMRFPLKPGYVTESMSGQPVSKPIGNFGDNDIGSLRVVGLPNMWFHFNSDYIMTTRLLPVSPTKTLATVAWYVLEDAKEGVDYDPERVSDVWRITSEQDWRLCEMNQAGMQSTRYAPGPLSRISEQGVSQFAEWYLRQLSRGEQT